MASATQSGTFAIRGETPVTRLGFGTSRLSVAAGAWRSRERNGALKTLLSLPKLGIGFINTADSFGLKIAESLIREALHPYDNLFVATKGGLRRLPGGAWGTDCRPENLIRQAIRSREVLGVERIDLWQLHRFDMKVPRDEQLDAMRQLTAEGVIRYAGLCEASVDDIREAQRVTPVATVQNRYNLGNRESDDVLAYCEAEGIAFIPLHPTAIGELARSGGILQSIARNHKSKPEQIALAWLLRRSPVMLPIPGASQIAQLRETVAAAAIALTNEEYWTLTRQPSVVNA